MTRIQVETEVRNASLAWLKEAGFDHALIVDGDELWLRGLMADVDEAVRYASPDAMACRMIPVIGLPGYPIEGAEDKVTIYIKTSMKFRNCRSPVCQTSLLNRHGVVHFTATRKTMEEIIIKHRESGHYDDPSYDFEGWISNVLPNAKPGLKNAHMYKPMQIWPMIRNWTREELVQLPQSLHQYIGATWLNPMKNVAMVEMPTITKANKFKQNVRSFNKNPFRMAR